MRRTTALGKICDTVDSTLSVPKPMKGERHAAIGTIARFATIAAQERSGETAPVQEENGLFSFFEPIGNRGSQFLRQDRCRLLFPPLLAKIDNAHEWHLLFVYPLSQCNQPIFSNYSVVIALE
jgi:hypothetical protein